MRSNRYLRRESSPLVGQDHKLITPSRPQRSLLIDSVPTQIETPSRLRRGLWTRARPVSRVRERAGPRRRHPGRHHRNASNARTERFNRIIKQTQAGRLRLPQHDQLPNDVCGATLHSHDRKSTGPTPPKFAEPG
jgi:hypothetical protein